MSPSFHLCTRPDDVLYLLSYGKNGGRGFDFSGTLSKRIFVNYPRPTKSYFSPLSVPFFMVIKPQHTNKYNLAFTVHIYNNTCKQNRINKAKGNMKKCMVSFHFSERGNLDHNDLVFVLYRNK